MYYRVCPLCGAHLDPCETCDCIEEREQKQQAMEEMLAVEEDGQMTLREAIAC